jgi:hypothetical protein
VEEGLRLILRLVALGCVAVVGYYWLVRWAAPAQDQAAVFVGLLLPAFGAALAKFAMELLVLPLALLDALRRVVQGRKPFVVGRPGRDPFDVLGRVVFVLGYGALSGAVGAVAGWAAGGAGFFAAAAAFAAFGAVLAMLLPADVLWGAGDNSAATPTQAARDAREAARRAGDPAVLLADRVARGLREALIEDRRED